MHVKKRNGNGEKVSFDKILKRITRLAEGNTFCNILLKPLRHINIPILCQRVIGSLIDNITTADIDKITSEESIQMFTVHPEYGEFAARILIDNLHKNINLSFVETSLTSKNTLFDPKYIKFIEKQKNLDRWINFENDFQFDYFGLKTLMNTYLLRDNNNQIIESPQFMWMRVAVALWFEEDKSMIRSVYECLSNFKYTHGTPVLFNAGLKHNQLSSCFLLAMKDDSVDGIFNTIHDIARISKYAGGIGLHVHNIRSQGSIIKSTGREGSGLIPMLKVINSTATYINQGGKRPGSVAIWIEPWHGDIEEVLDIRRNQGDDSIRARDLFLGLWVPDLFMKRVENDEMWSLFCPTDAPQLSNLYGKEFECYYEKLEMENKQIKQINARNLWAHILTVQIETGLPYMCYKDSVNEKNNQKHLGTIKSSNLCTEIMEYSDPKETAVCNLASISLTSFVLQKEQRFDFINFEAMVEQVVCSLDRVISVTSSPVDEASYSNKTHRPVGIGVQGLADTFALLKIPFQSKDAKSLNRLIFEHLYLGALKGSVTAAKKWGPFKNWKDSPIGKGILQYDFWNVTPTLKSQFDQVKKDIDKFGIRNSLLIAPMPTASTSQILHNNECIEPFTSNIYTRRTTAGDFTIINKYLIYDLMKENLWDENMKNMIIKHRGSIQFIDKIPEKIKQLYKTAFEISSKALLELAIERSPFIDQSQSLNLFMADPDHQKLTSYHFYGWKNGIKTGMYYLRSTSGLQAKQFSLDPKSGKDDPRSCEYKPGCKSCD
tara:strand:+ start:295 stop:2616 length:2322 start_codon:yes stop_codon:yes gene_type:complete